VRPARCDRTREAISLRLDGTLSTFEAVLLERHLRRCGECRVFADDVAAHTALLRSALLEEPSRHVALPAPRKRPLRRVAGGALTAAVAMAAAAVFSVTPAGRHAQTSATGAEPQVRTGAPVLITVPAQPTPGMKETVPRLTMQPASIADGPVHGLFSTPVRV
jgi:predicted anti-sigma-YlaC factor YlaD